jgi:hypothetical protein
MSAFAEVICRARQIVGLPCDENTTRTPPLLTRGEGGGSHAEMVPDQEDRQTGFRTSETFRGLLG